MLTAYSTTDRGPEAQAPQSTVPTSWIDLYEPTPEEDRTAEAFLGGEIPTQEEAREIEFSSRFYVENGIVFMTASLLVGVEDGTPGLTPFTFAMRKDKLVTLRYANMTAFRQFLARASKADAACTTSAGVFAGLLDAIIDRTADVIEHITQDVDRLNDEIFLRKRGRKRSQFLAAALGGLGKQGNLASKSRESLASLERLVQYAATVMPERGAKGDGLSARLKLALRDIRSLEDHVTFLLSKITFLLDATLGLVSNEQNRVVSVLTVVSTILLPPMLIGTIYGMNFKDMPELEWVFGYPVAVSAMILSAILPYLFFKLRGWM
ncbi:magnesium transporter [Kaistia algarum]|uniref:magnesium transporter CorA family protein n=1 Tax=Kaistia algarum TaxID=2083279 RepID=UPI000CE7F536|nr:magnesium transporter CorA family protein [Kaistia algarum]MCX5515689.1 magnesium transporter CorA family protein [Kaistia algarum]PPE80929.1 magnesium transporter [Kaistia algarum]